MGWGVGVGRLRGGELAGSGRGSGGGEGREGRKRDEWDERDGRKGGRRAAAARARASRAWWLRRRSMLGASKGSAATTTPE